MFVACPSERPERRAKDDYWVTVAPLDIGIGPLGFCVAVQPSVADGVWWWSPGRTGCSTRSTGPGVFHPDQASVSASAGAGTDVRFRVGRIAALQSGLPEFVDVRLILADGYLSMPASGRRVPVEQRNHVDVPEGDRPPVGVQLRKSNSRYDTVAGKRRLS